MTIKPLVSSLGGFTGRWIYVSSSPGALLPRGIISEGHYQLGDTRDNRCDRCVQSDTHKQP